MVPRKRVLLKFQTAHQVSFHLSGIEVSSDLKAFVGTGHNHGSVRSVLTLRTGSTNGRMTQVVAVLRSFETVARGNSSEM